MEYEIRWRRLGKRERITSRSEARSALLHGAEVYEIKRDGFWWSMDPRPFFKEAKR